jgi:hypothetical protein
MQDFDYAAGNELTGPMTQVSTAFICFSGNKSLRPNEFKLSLPFFPSLDPFDYGEARNEAEAQSCPQ